VSGAKVFAIFHLHVTEMDDAVIVETKQGRGAHEVTYVHSVGPTLPEALRSLALMLEQTHDMAPLPLRAFTLRKRKAPR